MIDTGDQWIELYNGGGTEVDLSGWSLILEGEPAPAARGKVVPGRGNAEPAPAATASIAASRGSTSNLRTDSYVFPAGTRLAAGEYLVLYGSTSDLLLRGGSSVLLLVQRDGAVVDRVEVPRLLGDASYSRDGKNEWRSDWAPSPGDLNLDVKPKKGPREK